MNPSDDTLFEILDRASTIAVIGASPQPTRPSHVVMAKLLAAGYRVIPVNPNVTEVLGQKAYPTLADVPISVDIVDVFRRAEQTPQVAEAAVSIGAKVLWLQLGVSND